MSNVGSRGVGGIDKWWILLSLADGAWQLDAPHVLSLGSEAVLCCEPVLGDMWIGSGNKVILLDTHLLSFQVREISVRVWIIPLVVQCVMRMSLVVLPGIIFTAQQLLQSHCDNSLY